MTYLTPSDTAMYRKGIHSSSTVERMRAPVREAFSYGIRHWTLTPRRLRPTREANKTQTRDPLNFGPCKADWPAAFVIK